MKYTQHVFHEPSGSYTNEDVSRLAKQLNVSLSTIRASEFLRGLNFEAEHRDSFEGIIKDELLDEVFAKTVVKKLSQIPDYYTRLEHMKNEALKYWHIDTEETPCLKN